MLRPTDVFDHQPLAYAVLFRPSILSHVNVQENFGMELDSYRQVVIAFTTWPNDHLQTISS